MPKDEFLLPLFGEVYFFTAFSPTNLGINRHMQRKKVGKTKIMAPLIKLKS